MLYSKPGISFGTETVDEFGVDTVLQADHERVEVWRGPESGHEEMI